MSTFVLVVEDESSLNTMICDYLQSHGYKTASAYDGAEAVRMVFEQQPDIIVLDLNLPQLAGMDFARTVRSQTQIPIIITTARGEEEDRLEGFRAGGDDYMVKPFSLPELSARIGAILRRTSTIRPDKNTVITVGNLIINTVQHTVQIHGSTKMLTATQFSLLKTLAEMPGRVYTREQLLHSIQSHEIYDRTIDAHIKNIRKVIEEDPNKPERLLTVWGVGYKLTAV